MDKRSWIKLMEGSDNKSMVALHKRPNSDALFRHKDERDALKVLCVDSNDEDQKYQDKSALALTIVHASYVHVPAEFTMDLQHWCERHGISTPLNGYVHIDPATGAALNILVGKVHWSDQDGVPMDQLQDAFMEQLEQLQMDVKAGFTNEGIPLVNDQTYLNIAQYNGADVLEKNNVFASLLNAHARLNKQAQLSEDSKMHHLYCMGEFGMSVMCKRMEDEGWRPGYAQVAYMGANSSGLEVGDQVSLAVPSDTVLSIPTENVQVDSTGKNVRQMEPPTSDWSVDNRKKFFKSFLENWLMNERIKNGLDDRELCQKKGVSEQKVSDKMRLELRRLGRKTLDATIGGVKQLSYGVFETSIFNTMQGQKPYTVLVSPDMSIVDGQHSTRDIGLIVWALKHKSTPIYNEEDIVDLKENVLQKQFEAFFLEEAKAWWEQEASDRAKRNK